MTGSTVVGAATAEGGIQAVPLAHLSVELGHLYLDDGGYGPEQLRSHFRQVAPWAAAAREICAAALPQAVQPRISTCFLVDDYLTSIDSPAVVIPELVQAAGESGLEIDYLARESGCVDAGGVPLANLMEARIVADPPPGTTGLRPPPTESGWLTNGQRSPGATAVVAMEPIARWAPPRENAARRHSVFVDVELWDERLRPGVRTWSCASLAAVWQLLRLGLLRDRGARVAVPRGLTGDLPDRWERLPAVIQLNPRAAPFHGYRCMSIIAGRYLSVEHAVRTILSQVAVDPRATRQICERGRREGLSVPAEAIERLDYVFTGGSARSAPPRPRGS